jgi:DNA modification methylase
MAFWPGVAMPEGMNQLYYGDNLSVLREHIKDETVDLIYLDPPFNSKRDYNLLFKSPKGQASDAQIEAFEDTWHWNEQAEREFDELLHHPNTDVAQMMQALRAFLGENDMMAYLTMMANRLIELHRVLKPSGSLYLHCDPTASHYLKIVLDGVFGKGNMRNEIIWRRTGSHNSAKRYGPIHDTIFFYSKSDDFVFNKVFRPYLKGHVDTYFKKEDARGRYWSNALTGAGTRNGESGKPWRGFNPTAKGRHWAIPGDIAEELGIEDLQLLEKLDAMHEAGYINLPDNAESMPEYRQYLHTSKGMSIQDIWAYQPHTKDCVYGREDEGIDEDVKWIGKRGDPERLGYETQKPVALLQRIIASSSNEGDVVLDPFCGCGTAVHAAQKLERKWIGIDITHLAISLIEKRLKDAFKTGLEFEIHGTPKDLESARDLAGRDKYQFQWWAVSLVEAQPFQGKKKGADTGIDGVKFFRDIDKKDVRKIVVSVKGGENLKADDVRSVMAVREREKADIALFISLEKPTRGMVKDAASAGFYESPNGKKYPRVQLLTIEGLLENNQRAEHPDYEPDLNFKKAKAETREKQEDLF